MPAKKTAIRAASMALLMGGAGAFAMQSGYVPGFSGEPSAPAPQETAELPSFVSASLSESEATSPPAPVPTTPTVVAAASMSPTALASPAMSGSAEVQLPRQAIIRPSVIPVTDRAAAAPVQPPLPETGGATGADVSEFGLPCGLSVSATAMPGAIVALDVMDPCQPEARVVVAHSGLTLTAQTDALGLATLDIPAFETPAFFSVEMPDGSSETTLVGLPDLSDYDRVAVQWEGDSQLELHAMEFGAEFGGPGHIWEEAPGSLSTALAGESGFLTEIGNADVETPMLAQIYTFPRATLRAGDAVSLSVDAPITERNCGQPITAHAMQMTNAGRVEITPIRLTMPGCDAVGDYLVLQNLLQDLRLASN